MRKVSAALASLVLAAGLSGCGLACTEIGYTNSLEVVVMGENAALATAVEICFEDECIRSEEILRERTWGFELFVVAPPSVTITAFDADGDIIAEADQDIRWSGTGEPNGAGCDNHSVTEPLSIDTSSIRG